MEREQLDGFPEWGKGSSARPEVVASEFALERRVSAHLARFQFTWLDVPGQAGRDSNRKAIERNAIALLSNHWRTALDPPSMDWLGHHCRNPAVRASGLWNVDHVGETPAEGWLALLEDAA